MEHRWGDRQRIILAVQLLGPGHTCTIGWLTDISQSGAYVMTTTAPAELSRLVLQVDTRRRDNVAGRPLQLQARVMRHAATGIGVEWEEFASTTLAEVVRIAVCTGLPRIHEVSEPIPHAGIWSVAMDALRDAPSSGVKR